ncbi:MAG: hypothetical protein LBO09_06775 [Candidatus Peribacteria bacterium]|jgi:hypothetical protein|nr:hypothetical protein [Candidatus Peribacteria bacterium]
MTTIKKISMIITTIVMITLVSSCGNNPIADTLIRKQIVNINEGTESFDSIPPREQRLLMADARQPLTITWEGSFTDKNGKFYHYTDTFSTEGLCLTERDKNVRLEAMIGAGKYSKRGLEAELAKKIEAFAEWRKDKVPFKAIGIAWDLTGGYHKDFNLKKLLIKFPEAKIAEWIEKGNDFTLDLEIIGCNDFPDIHPIQKGSIEQMNLEIQEDLEGFKGDMKSTKLLTPLGNTWKKKYFHIFLLHSDLLENNDEKNAYNYKGEEELDFSPYFVNIPQLPEEIYIEIDRARYVGTSTPDQEWYNAFEHAFKKVVPQIIIR